MPEEKLKEIERSAQEIIDSFSRAVEGLPPERETYYSHEFYNITRPDGEPSPARERAEFRRRLLEIAPGADDQGNLRVEAAEWAR